MGQANQRRSILVVDNERNIRKAVQYILEHKGYSVDSAEDGREAIEKITKNPPNLVILDLKVPNLSGYDVCQSVRSNKALDEVKIVVLSDCGKDIAIEKAIALGADGYVTKPFCTADLLKTVVAYCAQDNAQHA